MTLSGSPCSPRPAPWWARLRASSARAPRSSRAPDPSVRAALGGVTSGSLSRSALASSVPVRGLVPTFDVFASAGLDATAVSPSVRMFYEESASLRLEVEARWEGLLGLCYRLVRPLLARLGQVDFPTRPGFVPVSGSPVSVPPGLVPSEAVPVVWVRRHGRSDRVMYAALHSLHRSDRPGDDRVLMDFSLPVGPGVLTVSLRLEAFPLDGAGSGLSLTSFAAFPGDGVGTWFLVGGRALPVPIRERILVLPAGVPGLPHLLAASPPWVDAVAEHSFFLCGRRFLVLHYRIGRRLLPGPS